MRNWQKIRLGDICTLNYGKALTATKRVAGDIPVYSSAGITGWHNKSLLDSRSIIIGRKGTVGSVYLCGTPFWCIDTAYYILPKDDVYNFKYLYYRLCSLGLNKLNEDSAVPGLNRDTAYNQEFDLPPLEEQERIAKILGSLDDKIELNNKINRNLEAQAEALFKQWFVDFDFPDPSGNPYRTSGGAMIDSPMGTIPDGWRIQSLEDVCLLSAGGDKPKIFSKEVTEDCKIPIYSNGIDNEGLYGYTDKPKINIESVTVSARGTIGFVCLRLYPFVPIVRLITLSPKSEAISNIYLYLWLKNQNISGTGTTQQQLTVPDFKKSSIVIPDKFTVDRYSIYANEVYRKIDKNKMETKTLAELRNTLLPKLMNNEIKL